jgi:hypothetical protein
MYRVRRTEIEIVWLKSDNCNKIELTSPTIYCLNEAAAHFCTIRVSILIN